MTNTYKITAISLEDLFELYFSSRLRWPVGKESMEGRHEHRTDVGRGGLVISPFHSDGTHYHGVDVLRRARQEYKSRGFATKDGVKLSSWALSIRRSS